ncbi:HAD-IIB family hydrolase [Fimbriiglobus ruber]|uniref:Phosphoglycolate phosphatase, archaeal type n=1 Tax=Fimbriiglobus ruber TaxID=1908690 RepID=A0A225D895_9BACT|nr:HAD-IIB family hydrolase [Fimbriiglobus ruber]OWK34768.1 Phosphoglycolate phosphatase, archaeal type [Fimbriiglobus ruber]
MRYFALATDYDGTIAHNGRVDDDTIAALKKLRESGRKLLLVTGREIEDLATTFSHFELFDRIVAENGAIIYDPSTKETRDLAAPPPPEFVAELKARGVGPISVGHVIVATWEPHQETVLGVIRDHGLELQVIFNKGAVMILPSGVNKATGLAAALTELGLSAHNVVGAGDAENDHAFLAACECAVAVSNALPPVQERADIVTAKDHGAGVSELIGRIIDNDLADVRLTRHRTRIGDREGGGDEGVDASDGSVMVCGTSGSGKSTLTTGLLERLAASGHQFVVIDPEGDYSTLDFAVALGSPERAPLADEVLDLLRDPARNAAVNLLGIALDHRPAYFAELLSRLLELRTRTGRPHWIVVDEAHHLIPTNWEPTGHTLPDFVPGALFITVHPGSLSPPVLRFVNTLLAVGGEPAKTVREFCTASGDPVPDVIEVDKLPSGDAVLWRRGANETVVVHSERPKTERKRHLRKYSEGNLGADRSFYFRGPAGKLNLKAHNLVTFLQLANGVDDDTWEFHRGNNEYSQWLRSKVKDPALADEVATIETGDTSAKDSRAEIRAAIERKYTLPTDAPSGKVD